MAAVCSSFQKAIATHRLDLQGAPLTFLPQSIVQLSTLVHLDIRGTNITSIPLCLRQLSVLNSVRVDPGQIQFPPEGVVEEGVGRLMTFLNQVWSTVSVMALASVQVLTTP